MTGKIHLFGGSCAIISSYFPLKGASSSNLRIVFKLIIKKLFLYLKQARVTAWNESAFLHPILFPPLGKIFIAANFLSLFSASCVPRALQAHPMAHQPRRPSDCKPGSASIFSSSHSVSRCMTLRNNAVKQFYIRVQPSLRPAIISFHYAPFCPICKHACLTVSLLASNLGQRNYHLSYRAFLRRVPTVRSFIHL